MTLHENTFDGDDGTTFTSATDQRPVPSAGYGARNDGRLFVRWPGRPDRVTVDPVPPEAWLNVAIDRVTGDVSVVRVDDGTVLALRELGPDEPLDARRVGPVGLDEFSAGDVGTAMAIGPLPDEEA